VTEEGHEDAELQYLIFLWLGVKWGYQALYEPETTRHTISSSEFYKISKQFT
jgi:hypothetical protein